MESATLSLHSHTAGSTGQFSNPPMHCHIARGKRNLSNYNYTTKLEGVVEIWLYDHTTKGRAIHRFHLAGGGRPISW